MSTSVVIVWSELESRVQGPRNGKSYAHHLDPLRMKRKTFSVVAGRKPKSLAV